jgi:predicted nucleotidyltransferase
MEWMKTRFLDPPMTLVLVVLGGSRSYSTSHVDSDLDYFGYFKEESTVVRKYRTTHEVEGETVRVSFTCWPLSRVEECLRGNGSKWFDAMYTLENWLWHTPIIETDDARIFREDVVRPYLTSEFAVNYDEEGIDEFCSLEQKHRLMLSRHHLVQTGELLCDFSSLVEMYPEMVLTEEI